MLEILAGLAGRPCDPKKSEDERCMMVVLGVEISIDYEANGVRAALQEIKAKAWGCQLANALEAGVLGQGEAAQLAGRLNFAVTASASKSGRAFMKPVYAHSLAPLCGPRILPLLRRALLWWMEYLRRRPATLRRAGEVRKKYILYTDAAGETPHVAGVLISDDCALFTHGAPPAWLTSQFLERDDNQIGVLEAVAVVASLATFSQVIKGAEVMVFIDDQGVLGSLLKGQSRSPETNAMVGQIWLKAATDDVYLYWWRVESHANVSDGPTRDDFDIMRRLGASEWPLVWPEFLRALWAPIGSAMRW